MRFTQETYTQTLEVKQSKFIAYLTPYNDYETTLATLKESHPKARHFVVAYRYLNEFSQIVEHSSDDGEPKGTSGKPSLIVLQGADIINSAVIIVRYFGGTKLGTGGLVRAYSDAVNLVLDSAELLEYKKLETQKISFSYADVRMIDYECGNRDIYIKNKVFDSDVVYELEATSDVLESFLEEFGLILKKA